MRSTIEPVVGILDQNTFQLYKAPSYVPEGVVSFTSWYDMARMMNQDTMDRIRFHILGSRFCRPSKSRDDAAINLWITMTRDARLLPGIDLYKYQGRAKDKMGNIKYKLWGPHELLLIDWRPGDVRPILIAQRIEKMHYQARTIYQILLDDGRRVLTYRQAVRAIQDKWHLVQSVSLPGVLFSFYLRALYYRLQMIRKISYLDFCRSKDLKNIDLDMSSIEALEFPPAPEG